MLPGIQQFDLSKRIAIVTGGSRGLGEAMAAGLASAGASVVITSRHIDEASATAAQISAKKATQPAQQKNALSVPQLANQV